MSTSKSIRSHPKWSRLVDLVRELAFIDGGSDTAFTLASGRQSRWFFDTKPVMMHPEASHLIGEMLNLRMDELGADFVGGLELGAVPLTAIAVAMSSKDSPRRGFMVRKEPKGHGTGAWIEGPEFPEGTKVTVLEDVITTGGSAIKAVKQLRDVGYEVKRVVSIVDRQENGEADTAMKLAGLELISLYTLKDFIDEN